ncbi:MAG: hypothetical protein K0Q73_7635 [Paenibacillus sp.]|jgi:multiple sugar transport system substrate-binding protein|nr:hypothetical protein [Paenibacillus sp.]
MLGFIVSYSGSDVKGIEALPAYWSISATSKYKDDAFQVIMAMVSDEVQLADSKKGMLPTVVNKSIKDAFGQDRLDLQSKNIKSLFYYEEWALYSPKRKPGTANVATVVHQDSMAQAFPMWPRTRSISTRR